MPIRDVSTRRKGNTIWRKAVERRESNCIKPANPRSRYEAGFSIRRDIKRTILRTPVANVAAVREELTKEPVESEFAGSRAECLLLLRSCRCLRRCWCLGWGCRLRLHRLRLDALQHRGRSCPARRIHRQRDGSDHERNRRPCRRFGERRGCTAWPESSLAALAAECS